MNLLLHNVLGTSGALSEDSAALSLKKAHVPDLVKMLFAYVLYEVRNVAPADLVHMPFVIVEEVGQFRRVLLPLQVVLSYLHLQGKETSESETWC